MPAKLKIISYLLPVLICFLLSCLLSSCYSVRLVNIHGSSEEDLLNNVEGFWKQKKIHRLDTVVSLNLIQGDFLALEPCESGGFHAIEYRTTLGQVLLAGITLGRKRKIKVTYSCLLDDDQFND